MRQDDEDANGWDTRFRSAYSRLRRGLRPESHRSRAGSPGDLSEPSAKASGVTRVRFQIKPGQNKVAIKFDPAM